MSTLGASREFYRKKCDVCESDDVDKWAWHYCNQCKRYLCNACRYDHRTLGDLQDHTILSGMILPMQSASGDIIVLDNILDLKYKPKRSVNVRLPEDKEVPRISGCLFLPTEQLLLCDRRNNKIKLLDLFLVTVSSLTLEGANDAALVDDNTVVVTLPFQKKLQYVNLNPKLSAAQIISFDEECWGVAVAGNEIFVSFHDNLAPYKKGYVRVLDTQGNEKRRLGLDEHGRCAFQSPFYITTSSDGGNVYVSDFEANTVVCLKTNGDVVYTYTDKLRDPYGMYADMRGNLIVCSRCSYDAVHVVTAEGQQHKKLLTSYIGTKPMCVGFRPSDGTLVFGSADSAELTVFKMTPD